MITNPFNEDTGGKKYIPHFIGNGEFLSQCLVDPFAVLLYSTTVGRVWWSIKQYLKVPGRESTIDDFPRRAGSNNNHSSAGFLTENFVRQWIKSF